MTTIKLDVESQYKLGLAYYYGNGVEKNLDEAVRWLFIASDNFLKGAQNKLVQIYLNNEYIFPTYIKVKILHKLADNDDAEAQLELSKIYTMGWEVPGRIIGEPAKYDDACYYCDRAIANGNKEAIEYKKILESKITGIQNHLK